MHNQLMIASSQKGILKIILQIKVLYYQQEYSCAQQYDCSIYDEVGDLVPPFFVLMISHLKDIDGCLTLILLHSLLQLRLDAIQLPVMHEVNAPHQWSRKQECRRCQ